MNLKIINKNQKLQYWLAFLQAFPIIMLITNLSFYIFIALYFLFRKLGQIKFTSLFQYLSLLFGVGAIISTIDAFEINRSLKVLPNYLYWSFLIIVFYNYRNYINFKITRKAIFHGIVILNIYYWFIEIPYSYEGFLNKKINENGYAALMICFVPTSLKYLLVNKGKFLSIVFSISVVTLSLYTDSRAGTVLITLGVLFTLLGKNLSYYNLFWIFLFITFIYLLIYKSNISNRLIYKINPDIHLLVYSSDQLFTEDYSMLLRKAMVEKGLILFEHEPFTGLGLNNWSEYEVKFRGGFEGAERIINKSRIEKFGAHNSYIAFLGEGGLFVLIPFILLLILTILKLLFKFEKLDEFQQPILWSLIAMSIHIYFISAMLNSFTWYLLALGVAASNKNNT